MSTPFHRRSSDRSLFRWLDQNLTKTGKLLAAVGVIGSSILAGGTVVYHLDSRYVHTDAYAAELKQTNIRFDQSDLRTLEGTLVSVQGQIFTLERQPKLTSAEAQFLIELKGREGKIRRDIDDLRRNIQQAQERR